jgi:opacity protein-like surface antigen
MRIKNQVLCRILPAMLALAPAFAQHIEVQPFIGYKFGGTINVDGNAAIPSLRRINFNSSTNYGLTAGVSGDLIGVEFMWNRQPTEAVGRLAGGATFPRTIDLNIDQYHGNLLYYLTHQDNKVRPYVLMGVGATRTSGPGASDTRFSYAVGAGVKYFFSKHMGVRVQARYAPTYLNSVASGLWCDWWGACVVVGYHNYVQQGDVTAGWVVRF